MRTASIKIGMITPGLVHVTPVYETHITEGLKHRPRQKGKVMSIEASSW